MDHFSISQLSKYSGLKAHTIRAWEKRYNALDPLRSQGNTRYYSAAQLKRLMNLCLLKNEEKHLSVLCSYSNEELAERVKELFIINNDDNSKEELYINQFIVAGLNFDIELFNKTYASMSWAYPSIEGYKKIILPLLRRVGLLWASEEITVAMEHFISQMLKQKVYAAIDKLNIPVSNSKKWLLFLREGEFHELGLLMANLILREKGMDVLYLGVNMPVDQVKLVVSSGRYQNLLIFEPVYNNGSEIKSYLKDLIKNSSIRIYVAGGNNVEKMAKIKNIILLKTIDDLYSGLS